MCNGLNDTSALFFSSLFWMLILISKRFSILSDGLKDASAPFPFLSTMF